MGTYILNKAEQDLFEAIEHGDSIKFRRSSEDRTIRAEVLRHIVLGLPVIEESEGLLGAAASMLRGASRARACRVTGVGISIRGAIIDGRLVLDAAIDEGGGPICPLRFSKCRFDGGISGRHTRFSRLGFVGCRFRDPPQRGCVSPPPTVDLSGATIGSSLSMRRVRPDRLDPLENDPERVTDFLWIRAIGARIDGEVDLSYARLRAPPERRDRPLSEPPVCALDLSLARVNGDIQFLNGARSEGAIWARGAVIRGDVWMSGALIEGGEKFALFFQSAEIGGSLMLDGRAKDAERRGECELFRTYGQLNLYDIQVGGTLQLSNAKLHPPRRAEEPPPAPPAVAEPGDDAALPDIAEPGDDPADFACLRLDDARIGDSVLIQIVGGERCRLYGQLYFPSLEVKNALTISDCYIGMAVDDPRDAFAIQARFLTARQVTIENVEPLLWDEADKNPHPEMMGLSIDLEGARIDSLKLVDCWLNGRLAAPTLRCAVDVKLDARIGVGVDLSGAEIGGSLDISELRLDGLADGLDLRDATVGRTLNLTQREVRGRTEGIELAAARQVALTSLGSMILLECLWRCGAGDRSTFQQTGFLLHGERAFLLDGKQVTLDSIVGHFGHSIVVPAGDGEDRAAAAKADRDRATEYVRLACAYVRAGEPGMMIASREDAAQFCGHSPAAPFPGIEPGRLTPFAVPVAKQPGEFFVNGYCASGGALAYRCFRLRTKVKPVQLVEIVAEEAGMCAHPPIVEGQFVRRAADGGGGEEPRWVMPPALDKMEPVDPRELPDLEAKLIHHVRSSCAINGIADLTGLTCSLLDDNSGRAWGSEPIIPMNHFVYSRTTWIGRDRVDPATHKTSMLRSLRVWIARELPMWVIRLFGLNARLSRSSRHCTGWQARLNWIYRQFRVSDYPMPSRYRISQAEYAPQPFEQAIKVCRAEGREDYAIEFEIEKQKIEWRLFNRRNWPRFVMVGLAAAVFWLLSSRAQPLERFGIALALAVGISTISHLANFTMRIMFGYLRKPVRAIGSLVAAFLIGWGGVHIANARHLMVIDVEPVAGLVGLAGEGGNEMQIAIQRSGEKEPPVRDVHCGRTISAGLYALDVLIPLIDLREESRCEIGRANDFQPRLETKPVWIGRLMGDLLDSKRFWSTAKAAYAIAGWFIVSLSILTFAHTNRTRTGSG